MKFLRKILNKFIKPEQAIVHDTSSLEKDEPMKTVVLDTSALESEEVMKVIEKVSKVILLTGTIKELDNYKNAEGIFGSNIRYISKKSREDVNQEKYVCVGNYENSDYQDDNIIEYCRNNKSVTILTSDNNLCNFAKAYSIPYIYMQVENNNKPVKQNINIVENKPSSSIQTIKKEKTEMKRVAEYNKYSDFEFHKKTIRAKQIKNYYMNIRLVRDGKIINLKEYKEGDFIYLLKFHKILRFFEIEEYEIIKYGEMFDVREINFYRVYYLNDIFRLHFPEELEEEIRKFFLDNYY